MLKFEKFRRVKNFLKICFIFLTITLWIFSGWPQIFNFPPKIQVAYAIQFGTPDGDISAGSWTDEGTVDNDGNLYTSIDESSADGDDSYILSAGTTTTSEVSLTNVTDPGVDTGHEIHIWMRAIGSGGGEKLTVSLFQGTTQIEEFKNNTNRSSTYAEKTLALAAANVANITDYTDLRIRIISATLGSGEELRVTKAELQIPDVAVGETLTFSISDNAIGFGTLSTSAATWATGDETGSSSEVSAHTLTASTNATNGYIITVNGTTLTSGGDTITAIGASATDVTSGTGTEQFGIRLTTSGGNGTVSAPYNGASNMYALDTTAFPDVVASDSDGDDVANTYSVFYAANIAVNTEAHTDYSSTLTYIATGNF